MSKVSKQRTMVPIPVSLAKEIANQFGYDQVIIYARRVGEAPDPFGEHMTTCGVDPTRSAVAARIGKRLQTELMGWQALATPVALADITDGPWWTCWKDTRQYEAVLVETWPDMCRVVKEFGGDVLDVLDAEFLEDRDFIERIQEPKP